ncbi:MAG: exodeoxyribonuclease VII small subunit [Balneolaceae bacterium]|nr:MAG: exodeoxyribonuclease VII small subunit [Balneolaceae bacterium]
MVSKERQGFEEALQKLETIVEALGDQEISLENSVELYEEGLKLSKYCMETLENASLRIEKLETSDTLDDNKADS